MKKILVQSLAMAFVLCTGAATAQNDPNDPMKDTGANKGVPSQGDASFDELDLNKDGYLTKNEVMGNPAIAQNFARVDTDGDGKISLQEWKAMGHHDDK